MVSTILLATFGTLLVLLIIGTPVGVALGVAALLGMHYGEMPFLMFIQRLYNTFDSFPLLAVPFFILAGDIMQHGSIANSLLGFCRALIGHVRGGLSLISILTCLFYGALSGSAPATTAAVGGIMIPAMAKEGYPRTYASAVNAAGGCLGVMIPPSVPLILYGSSVGCSISDLFLAGIIPGLLVGLVFMAMCYVYARVNHWGTTEKRTSLAAKAGSLWEARYAIMVPIIVLGGIYGGILTPTEAGCAAVVYSLVVEMFITRAIDLKKLRIILFSSMRTTGAIFMIIATANALSTVLVYYNAHELLCSSILSITSSYWGVIAILTVIFLVLGTFVEASVVILVLAPMLLPVVNAIGMNLVHFGLFMLILLATGFLTPPVGVNLFVAAGIGNVSFSKLSVACVPFCLAMIGVSLVIAAFPIVVTFVL